MYILEKGGNNSASKYLSDCKVAFMIYDSFQVVCTTYLFFHFMKIGPIFVGSPLLHYYVLEIFYIAIVLTMALWSRGMILA